MGSKGFSEGDALPLYANRQSANTQLVSVYRYRNKIAVFPVETLPSENSIFRANYTCSHVECVISEIKMLYEDIKGIAWKSTESEISVSEQPCWSQISGESSFTFNFKDNFESDVRRKLFMIHQQETVFVCYYNIKENQVYLSFERPVSYTQIYSRVNLHDLSTWKPW